MTINELDRRYVHNSCDTMFSTQIKWQRKTLSENQYRLNVSNREQIGRIINTKLNGINVIKKKVLRLVLFLCPHI
jgi:hypothetical protein